jgi:ribosomal protein S18 acetylase RimI-like enzyme
MSDLSRAGLRRAGLADLETIAALEATCFAASDGAFSRRQLRALLRNANAHWLLSVDGRATACWLRVSNGRARWARLYSLAVHPAARGQGWGRRLIEAGLHWMQDQGIGTCRAEVKAGNTAARRLYAACGFRETGFLRDYYAPEADGVRLAISLDRP